MGWRGAAQLAEFVLFADTVTFMLSMNILVHSYMNLREAYILNAVCCGGAVVLAFAFWFVILARQAYKNPRTGALCTRHLYKIE